MCNSLKAGIIHSNRFSMLFCTDVFMFCLVVKDYQHQEAGENYTLRRTLALSILYQISLYVMIN